MRRFSQRSALVTLSEINITPLLDLAWVLLIIFVITAPLLEQSINLNLPKGGRQDKKIDPHDVRTVEISPKGEFRFDRRPMGIDQIEANLIKDFQMNPNLVVYIRADETTPWKNVAAIMDRCQRNGITRLSPRMEPLRKQ